MTLRLYLIEARIGKGNAYPGADDLSGFYVRNLKIFSNLTRIVDSPNDLVVVLFGSGRAPHLREYVRASGDFTSIPVSAYLH